MGNVLAFCEFSEGSVRTSALSNLSFARQAAGHHSGDVIALLVGKGASAAGADAARFAAKVITVEDDALEHFMAETYAPIISRIAGEQGASVVCATATAIGKDVLPRVAQTLDAAMASDIAAVEGKDTFRRAILAGNAFSSVKLSSDVMCVSPRQSEFEGAAPLDSAGAVEVADAGTIDSLGAEIIRIETTKSERPDLNDADIIVSGGRGMGNGENFGVLEKLADVLGAAMGASRAATDAGFVPADWQVGQTGKIVAPKLYFAVAISGAIQHLAGMKGSKTIVAINKKDDEPIFEVADYGLVSTWEEAIPALTEALEKHKAAQG